MHFTIFFQSSSKRSSSQTADSTSGDEAEDFYAPSPPPNCSQNIPPSLLPNPHCPPRPPSSSSSISSAEDALNTINRNSLTLPYEMGNGTSLNHSTSEQNGLGRSMNHSTSLENCMDSQEHSFKKPEVLSIKGKGISCKSLQLLWEIICFLVSIKDSTKLLFI